MLNVNNNILVSRTTNYVGSGNIVIGNQQVPDGFTRVVSHSYDCRNLISHTKAYAEKNNILPDNQLYVIKSKMLAANAQTSNTWNDQTIVSNVNKFSMFKQNIVSYKTSLKDVLQKNSFETYFSDMKEASHEITDSFLKSVYYTEGVSGLINIQSKLDKIVNIGGLFNPDCLRVYNLLIYSAPFILTDAYNNSTLTSDMFYFAPYETIASNLYIYINTFQPTDLTAMLKIQLRLENAMPNMGAVKDSYETFMSTYRHYKMLQIGLNVLPIALKLLIPLSRRTIEYLLLITTNKEEHLTVTHESVTPIFTPDISNNLTPEEVDAIMRVVFDTLFNA